MDYTSSNITESKTEMNNAVAAKIPSPSLPTRPPLAPTAKINNDQAVRELVATRQMLAQCKALITDRCHAGTPITMLDINSVGASLMPSVVRKPTLKWSKDPDRAAIANIYVEMICCMNVKARRLGEIAVASDRLVRSEQIGNEAHECDTLFGKLLKRTTIVHQVHIFDLALDALRAAKVKSRRDQGGNIAIGISTDEAAPVELRYLGLRFQVTIVYNLEYKERGNWDVCDDYPFRRMQSLCDLTNCRGKTGADIMDVLSKQLLAKGYLKEDVVSGSTDGGGENVGATGCHAQFGDCVPSYVIRRGLDHMGWRVADQGLLEMGARHAGTKAICTYLQDGVTWQVLSDIATSSVGDGGLGLMARRSPEHAAFFLKAKPPTIMQERPETDFFFLQWLVEREESTLFRRVVVHDNRNRRLIFKAGPIALASIQNIEHACLRPIDMSLLHRGLFLYKWGKKHVHIAGKTTFDELLERATNIMTTLNVDDHFLNLFGWTRADVAAKGISADATWVEVVLRMRVDDGVANRMLPIALETQRHVSLRMASHLTGVAQNLRRSFWISAGMLDHDPLRAQVSEPIGAQLDWFWFDVELVSFRFLHLLVQASHQRCH